MSLDKYCKCAVTEVKTELEKSSEQLKTKVTMPVANNYCLELDVMPKLDAQQANYYQELIGILWWIVELRCIDIVTAVAYMLRYKANP